MLNFRRLTLQIEFYNNGNSLCSIVSLDVGSVTLK